MPITVAERVDEAINKNKIAVFSKSWCSFSSAAKRYLKESGVNQADVFVEDIDLEDDESEIQGYLLKKTGQRTVPNIFINGQHVGGFSELSRIGRDKLKTMTA